MQIQELNTRTYVLDASATSSSISLAAALNAQATAVIYNNSNLPVFLVAGSDTAAPTAVFPTSSNDPKEGKVIGAKTMVSFNVPAGTKHIAGIQAVAGVGSVYISFGEGF